MYFSQNQHVTAHRLSTISARYSENRYFRDGLLLVLTILIIKSENLTNGDSTFIRLLSDISQSCYLNEGQEVNIICPFLQSKWYYNEQYFNKSRTLNIKTITPEEAGTYSCTSIIRNTQYHNIKWANITVIVSGKLKKDKTSGKEVSLKVETLPKEPKVLIYSGGLIGSKNLKDINRKRSPPVIRKEALINQTVFEDDNVKFLCDVMSELEPNLIWLKHYDKLNITNDHFDFAQNPNTEKLWARSDEPHILRLAGVQSKDQGWYTCIAANSAGETNSSSYLRVLRKDIIEHNKSLDHDSKPNSTQMKPPEFLNLRITKQVHKTPGSSLQFFCDAIGYPLPNITWTHNGTEIKRKATYTKWSMQLDDVSTDDSGFYVCKVCNPCGCIENYSEVFVSNRSHNIFKITDKFPRNQTVLANTSAQFECSIASLLEPHIEWVKITEKYEKFLANPRSRRHYIILDGVPHMPNILNFTKVTHEDEGWYVCLAYKDSMEYMQGAYLHVVDKLPQQYGLQRGHPDWIIIVALLFLLGTIFIVYILRKKLLKQRIKTYQWTKKVIIYKTPPPPEDSSCDLQMPVIKIEKQRTKCTSNSSSNHDCGFNEYEIALDFNWEIPRTQLSLGSTLGEGAFGLVVMAQGSGLPRVSSNAAATCIVAVKMVKEEHTDADMASLVHEMEVMKMMEKHINIINLLGCCSQNGPLWVIVEFAPHGNLKDFLKKNRPPASWDSCGMKINGLHLISFAFQIAQGMEYLASRRCIHRDLAARNVLVGEDYIMKIADFGLARDIQDTDYYRKNTNGLLPIKWMAPESIQEQFYDSMSDVWSYGVLLWEIMSYGEQPYPDIKSTAELYGYLERGQRMEKPPLCSLNIYKLMRQCWNFDSNARPGFMEIVKNLDEMLQLTTNEEYLDLYMPKLVTNELYVPMLETTVEYLDLSKDCKTPSLL